MLSPTQDLLTYYISRVVAFRFAAITCPFGEQSDLPSDDEDDRFTIFVVETPDDTEPEDVLKNSGAFIEVPDSEKITITVSDEPNSFVVMDIMYESDVPTRVVMFTSEGELVNAQANPVSQIKNIFISIFKLKLQNDMFCIFLFFQVWPRNG